MAVIADVRRRTSEWSRLLGFNYCLKKVDERATPGERRTLGVTAFQSCEGPFGSRLIFVTLGVKLATTRHLNVLVCGPMRPGGGYLSKGGQSVGPPVAGVQTCNCLRLLLNRISVK